MKEKKEVYAPVKKRTVALSTSQVERVIRELKQWSPYPPYSKGLLGVSKLIPELENALGYIVPVEEKRLDRDDSE